MCLLKNCEDIQQGKLCYLQCTLKTRPVGSRLSLFFPDCNLNIWGLDRWLDKLTQLKMSSRTLGSQDELPLQFSVIKKHMTNQEDN